MDYQVVILVSRELGECNVAPRCKDVLPSLMNIADCASESPRIS